MTKQNASRLPKHGGPDTPDSDDNRPGEITFKTIVVTAVNVGNFDGDHNIVAIGNQDGLVFGSRPAAGIAGLLSAAQAVPGPHPGIGNSVLVTISDAIGSAGDVIIGSYNGNENTVVIGAGNGIGLIVPSSSPALTFAAPVPRAGFADRLGLADNLPGHISYQSLRVKVENVGNNDGNFNSVLIGNQDGILFGATPGAGGPAIGGAVGNNSGNDNTVNIGNANGATIHLNGSFGLLAGGLPPSSLTGGVVSVANLPALADDSANTWFRLGADPFGSGGEMGFFGLDTPRMLKFMSVRIDVRDSGNNDGNGNVVSIGNANGVSGYAAGHATGASPLTVGSYDGNGNLVGIGNGNGINLFFDGGSDSLSAAPAAASSAGRQVIYQSIGISVANSGNNDGNNNTVAIGNANGIAGAGPYTATGGLNGVIGSHDGNANTVAAGNGNGVNIHLGSNSGVIIGEYSGVASGYWLQDGIGDTWFGATQQEIGRDLTSGLLPKLGVASLSAITFESVNISALNVGYNDGYNNTVAIGNHNGITGTLGGGAAGSFVAGFGLSAGSFDGNGNLAQIGNGNGVSLYV